MTVPNRTPLQRGQVHPATDTANRSRHRHGGDSATDLLASTSSVHRQLGQPALVTSSMARRLPKGTYNPMVDKKPTTAWAVVSVLCSIVACLGAVALPAIYSSGMRHEPTGVSAGIGVMFVGLLSIALGLSGAIFGIVRLRKIRSGECGGRAAAWMGIVLGCLPFVVLVGYMMPVLWQALWDWIGNLGRRKQGPI